MKKHILAGALAALWIGLAISACDGGDDGDRGWGSGGGSGDTCNRYASCGSCTPVNGCGWCATGPSQGLCASDPDECDQAQSFSWTWNASGCVVEPDASVLAALDAGGEVPDAASSVGDSTEDSAAPVATDSAGIDGGTPLASESGAPTTTESGAPTTTVPATDGGAADALFE